MAPRIKAVNAYRPRIEQGSTVQKPELLRAVSRATSLVEGSVDLVTKEMRPPPSLPQIRPDNLLPNDNHIVVFGGGA